MEKNKSSQKDSMRTPCSECPFLNKYKKGFTLARLIELALVTEFHCHKTGGQDEESGDFHPNKNSKDCAGAKIFLAKRKDQYTYGFDDTNLNMKADIR